MAHAYVISSREEEKRLLSVNGSKRQVMRHSCFYSTGVMQFVGNSQETASETEGPRRLEHRVLLVEMPTLIEISVREPLYSISVLRPQTILLTSEHLRGITSSFLTTKIIISDVIELNYSI